MNLQRFEYYLKSSGLAARTIAEHLGDISRFAVWIKENHGLIGAEGGFIEMATIRYNDLLGYVQAMKSKGLSVATQNIRIASIRKYFEHLKEEGEAETNPARRLHIKGAIKKIIHHPLSYGELEELYREYSQPKEHYREEKHRKAHERNTIILGLMIGQGVHSGELGKIEIHHVKLNEGRIYIPGARRSNGRELKLASWQIILLHQYMTEADFTGDMLFDCHPYTTIYYLVKELKGLNPVIKNPQHIRASVILHWMRMYSKREVQYMAGHKWISSTEHYQVQELEGLTELLEKHHPFH